MCEFGVLINHMQHVYMWVSHVGVWVLVCACVEQDILVWGRKKVDITRLSLHIHCMEVDWIGRWMEEGVGWWRMGRCMDREMDGRTDI